MNFRLPPPQLLLPSHVTAGTPFTAQVNTSLFNGFSDYRYNLATEEGNYVCTLNSSVHTNTASMALTIPPYAGPSGEYQVQVSAALAYPNGSLSFAATTGFVNLSDATGQFPTAPGFLNNLVNLIMNEPNVACSALDCANTCDKKYPRPAAQSACCAASLEFLNCMEQCPYVSIFSGTNLCSSDQYCTAASIVKGSFSPMNTTMATTIPGPATPAPSSSMSMENSSTVSPTTTGSKAATTTSGVIRSQVQTWGLVLVMMLVFALTWI